MQQVYHALQGFRHRLTPYLLPAAGEIPGLSASQPVFHHPGETNHTHRFFLRATLWAGDPGNSDGDMRMTMRNYTGRHFRYGLLGYRSILLKC